MGGQQLGQLQGQNNRRPTTFRPPSAFPAGSIGGSSTDQVLSGIFSSLISSGFGNFGNPKQPAMGRRSDYFRVAQPKVMVLPVAADFHPYDDLFLHYAIY